MIRVMIYNYFPQTRSGLTQVKKIFIFTSTYSFWSLSLKKKSEYRLRAKTNSY